MNISVYKVKTGESKFKALFVGGDKEEISKRFEAESDVALKMSEIDRVYVFEGDMMRRVKPTKEEKSLEIEEFLKGRKLFTAKLPEIEIEDEGEVIVYDNKVTYSQSGLKYNNEELGTSMLEEEKFLGKHLNYYLDELGLKKVDMTKLFVDKKMNAYPLYLLSTCGDAELKSAVLENVTDGKLIGFINSNSYQKAIMVRMGFGELSSLEDHLVGTLFEAIYHIAVLQNNKYLLKNLLDELLGENVGKVKRTVSFID